MFRSLKCVPLSYDKMLKVAYYGCNVKIVNRIIIRIDVIFNDSLMSCLERKDFLTEKDVQIEAESSHN